MAEAAAAASVQQLPGEFALDVPLEEEPGDFPSAAFDSDTSQIALDGFELGGSREFSDSGDGNGAFLSGSLADFSQQGGTAAEGSIDFSDEGGDQPLELASPHEFLAPPEPLAAPVPSPLRTPQPQAAGMRSAPEASPVRGSASLPEGEVMDRGEAALRAALADASREVIERVVWEVVPQLAEAMIREQLDRLVRERG